MNCKPKVQSEVINYALLHYINKDASCFNNVFLITKFLLRVLCTMWTCLSFHVSHIRSY